MDQTTNIPPMPQYVPAPSSNSLLKSFASSFKNLGQCEFDWEGFGHMQYWPIQAYIYPSKSNSGRCILSISDLSTWNQVLKVTIEAPFVCSS